MQYVIKKLKNNKLFSCYNEVFTDANKAITSLNNWMEFEASLFQHQMEPNTIYTINIEDNYASIIKIVTSEENIKIIKKNMGVTNLKPEEYLKRRQEMTDILAKASQTEIFRYQIEVYEDDSFVLPENSKEEYHIISYKNDAMIDENIIKTRREFLSVGMELNNDVYKDFFDFAINIAETMSLTKKKDAIMVKPDKNIDGRCYIYQGKTKLCTVFLYPSSTNETIV